MFELHDVWISDHKAGEQDRWTLAGVTLAIPVGRRIALFGADKKQNSAVLRMLSGVDDPDKGAVRRSGLPCWPFDYLGFMDNGATLGQNAAFLGRVYGVDSGEVARIATALSGVRVVRGKPLKHYLGTDRRALQLGLTLAFQFDSYFVDEKLPTPPAETAAACDAAIADRISNATVIWATTRPDFLANFCDAGLVLDQGSLTFYNHYERAAEAFRRSIEGKASNRNDRKSREDNRGRRAARRSGKVDPEDAR